MKTLIFKTFAATAIGIAMAFGGTAVVSATTAQTTSANCVDGKVRANLSVNWVSNDHITVKTVNDKLLCADVTVYFSSYTMPDNYDGTGFGGPTSYPQQLFKTTSTTLKVGTNGQTTMEIATPEACKNMQIDFYYGPEITVVTAAGHGAQYITGKVLSKTAETCDVPVTPIVPPQEAQTPPTPAPQVTVTDPVQTLPNTGNNAGLIAAATGVAIVAGTATAELVRVRS